MYHHQDWTPVVFTKKTPKKPMQQNPEGFKERKKLEEDEIYTLNKITPEKSQLLSKERAEKGLSQKDLANSLNFPVSTISDYESGKIQNYSEKTYNIILKKIRSTPKKS